MAIFEEGDVSLSETELSVAGERFPLADVTQAHTVRVAAPANGPILMLVAGGVCVLGGTGGAGVFGYLLGGALLVAGAVWFTQKKPVYRLQLQTEAGELVAFECPEEARTRRLEAAVRGALAGASAP